MTKLSGGRAKAPIRDNSFPCTLAVTVTDGNGSPLPGLAVTFTPVAGPNGAGATFASSPAMPVVTDQNGNAVAPALTANGIGGPFSVVASVDSFNVTFNLTNLAYGLGTPSAMVGSLAGRGSVLLVAGGAWTASSSAPWLTLPGTSQSGSGDAVVKFSYAANTKPGPRTGTITIAGFTFTVTQAGSGYLPVYPIHGCGLLGFGSAPGLGAGRARQSVHRR